MKVIANISSFGASANAGTYDVVTVSPCSVDRKWQSIRAHKRR